MTRTTNPNKSTTVAPKIRKNTQIYPSTKTAIRAGCACPITLNNDGADTITDDGHVSFCYSLSSWLWHKARDVESRQLDTNTIKDAENKRLKTKRDTMINLADEAGQAEAIASAQKRWGGEPANNERL